MTTSEALKTRGHLYGFVEIPPDAPAKPPRWLPSAETEESASWMAEQALVAEEAYPCGVKIVKARSA